ncbi:MAG: MBL fold metallo-hydrolase [Clostridia bacterium]
MLNFHPLYSSSSGNMFHLESAKANILIDIGVTFKAANDGLKLIEKSFNDIDALFITHEHIDHIKGLSLLCRKTDIPVYACGKTADFLNEMLSEKNISANIIKVNYNEKIQIKDLDIIPFETNHDAIMPCGYKIFNEDNSITYATDLGVVSNEVFENLKSSNLVILEANYDETMLDFGKYPYYLKRRIKSDLGHLSNNEAANTILRLVKDGQANFLLAHISENNNTLDLARDIIKCTLQENDIDFNTLNISFASKSLSNEVIEIC